MTNVKHVTITQVKRKLMYYVLLGLVYYTIIVNLSLYRNSDFSVSYLACWLVNSCVEFPKEFPWIDIHWSMQSSSDSLAFKSLDF